MSDAMKREFVGITEQGVEELRSRIGVKIEDTVEPWCYEATRDNIRHYAHGIGDDNPLWCDPKYAEQSRYGGLIALPSFLFACDRIASGYVGGLPGIHAMFAGVDFTWHKPIVRNTEFNTVVYLKDLIEHNTRFAGRSFQQIYHCDYYDAEGDLISEADTWCFRTDRDQAREQGTKYTEVKASAHKVYTDEEIEAIYELYRSEQRRGSELRYWEDVEVGQTLPPLVKGPMTITGFIAYTQGWGGLYIRANKLATDMYDQHPGLAIKNRFGVPDCPERVHWDEDLALKVGAPGAYDYGPERCSWMSQLITDWIGDDGMLHKLKSEVRRHNPEGDTVYLNGEVVRMFQENNKNYVEISILATNQDDELSARGYAIAQLPGKA
jgi:acyl dehydratase